ncbi:hypothetical protein DFH06DRAFT_1320412 [Mycena polygramma]|nr:hypothetical protein DFH06DRAFT_1320412 [Mycena polygramma]
MAIVRYFHPSDNVVYCDVHSIVIRRFAIDGDFSAWAAEPFLPPSNPLAPYLSAWLPQGSGQALNDVWPQFWTGSASHISLGWAGLVNVDGTTYSFLGNPVVPGSTFTKATQTSAKFTSTQSTFVLTAGPIELTVNFLSPVEPTNLLHQSIPFSYLAVSAISTDEWVTGDNSLVANWTTTTGNVYTHQVQLAQTDFGEFSNQGQTQYGSVYFSCINANALSYQTGPATVVRAQYIKNAALANTKDTNFRAVSNDWPVFAFAHTITVGTTVSTPVKFTIGQVRDPAVECIVAGNVYQKRSYYWWSTYSTSPPWFISDFINSYPTALDTANTFDAKVQSDASAISTQYAGIAALAVRQDFGATELTISKADDGSWNTTDILMFIKAMGQNINTVDIIYPAWPIFVYTNPTLGKYLLDGLLAYQATGQYPNAWAVHDLGKSCAEYPAAIVFDFT